MSGFCDASPCPTEESIPATYDNPFRLDTPDNCLWIEGYEEYVSYAGSLGLTNITLGSGSTTVARYKRLNNRTIHFYVILTLGTGFSITAGVVLNFPVEQFTFAACAPIAAGVIDVSAANHLPCVVDQSFSTTQLQIYSERSDLADATFRAFSSAGNAPIAWAAGDQIWVGGIYECVGGL